MKRLGATIMEVALAAAVLGIVVMGFATFQIATVKQNQRERDRGFALQKATQMMEELKIKVAGNANTLLDDYGQADTTYSFILSTDPISVPSAPLSDNIQEAAGYRFVRQIWVRPLPRDKGARQVTVRVFRSNGKNTPGIKAGAVPLASLANIFKSTPNVVLPTQQFDIYSIGAHETSLGKLDYCAYPWPSANEGYLNAAFSYLSNATSGLAAVVRPVRVTSYGRDTYYSPLHNDHEFWTWYNDKTQGATIANYKNVPLNHVYFRPGMNEWWHILDPGRGQSSYWHAPTTTSEAIGPTRYIVQHGNTADHLYEKQAAYSFADQNNHAVRYFENLEKQAIRYTTRYFPTDTAKTMPYHSYTWWPDRNELTLRGLLDEMLAGKRKNAILLNMHGEIFPMIPMRNYSDAAKVPAHHTDLTALRDNWGVNPVDASQAKDGSHARLVTHPRALEYGETDVVELRVFPHLNDPEYIKNATEPPDAYRKGVIVLRGMKDHMATWNGADIAQNVEVQVCFPIHGKWPGGTASEDTQIKLFNDVADILKGKFVPDPALYSKGVGLGTTWHMDAYRWVRAWPTTGTLRGTDSEMPAKGKAIGKAGKGTPIPFYDVAQAGYIDSVFVQNVADPANGLLAGDVVIKLKNINYTPDQFDGSDDGSWGKYGLHKDYTLHGMNYFPDPLLPDLTDGYGGSDKQPRNSARFRLLFKTNKPKTVEIITSIGDDPNLNHHQAPNRSRTWVWVGENAPETERYQLVGDPRHNPYGDVRADKRYNRYFGDFDDAYLPEDGDTDWNRFDDTANGWGPNTDGKGRIDVDVPRYFELWRKALLNANAMLATPNANAFKVVALGGEYGAYNEAQGGRVYHSRLPITGEKDKGDYYDEWRNPTLVTHKDEKWYAKPWLGELYPDDQWEDWQTRGNLRSGDFRRKQPHEIDAFKKAYAEGNTFKRTKHVDHWGPISFYNATTHFAFRNASGNTKIAGAGAPSPTDGRAVSADLKALLRETFHSYRSFTWNEVYGDDSNLPIDHSSEEAKNTRTAIESGLDGSSNNAYYKASDDAKSVAPFIVRRDGKASYHLAFTPWNSWSGANDPYSMMRVFAASVLQGYMDMASPEYDVGGSKAENRIRLLPRVGVVKPEDDALATGSALAIEWKPEWTRWDGKPYSRLYATYGDDGDQPKLQYIVKYSEDGKNWTYANGPYIGTQVGPYARFNKTYATENTSITLNTAGFKNKQYQVRIEAWRVDGDTTKIGNFNAPPYSIGTYDAVHHSYAQFSVNYTK